MLHTCGTPEHVFVATAKMEGMGFAGAPLQVVRINIVTGKTNVMYERKQIEPNEYYSNLTNLRLSDDGKRLMFDEHLVRSFPDRNYEGTRGTVIETPTEEKLTTREVSVQ